MEEWRPVVGFEGLYSVTSTGRVRSEKTGRVLKPTEGPDGYYRVTLKGEGKRSSPTVHRLIMEAFVGPRPDGLQIRHLDGDKSNNVIGNLRYGTPKENGEDNVRLGVTRYGKATHCPQGHEYTGWNLIEKQRNRGCRACTRAAVEMWRLRQRGVDANKHELADMYYRRHQLGEGVPNKHYSKESV